MYPAEIVVAALQKAGSIQSLAQRAGVTDQSVRNWLNFMSCPTDQRLKQLVDVAAGIDPEPVKAPPAVNVVSPDPVPPVAAKKAWKQRVEITRLHPNADYGFGVTDDALITFIVPHVADKLKDAGVENGDEVTLVVRSNDHPGADLYAFKWAVEDEADGY